MLAAVQVPDKINQVEWVCARRSIAGDGELMLGHGEDANSELADRPDENPPGLGQRHPGTHRGDTGLGANSQGVFQPGGAVIQDMVVRQGKHIYAGFLYAVDAGAALAEDRTGLGDGRSLRNQRALQVRNHKVRRFELTKQVIEQAAGIALLEIAPIPADRTDIRAYQDSCHFEADQQA